MKDPILYKFERFLNWWDEISENNIEYFMELGLDLRQKEAFDEFHQFVYELIKAKENNMPEDVIELKIRQLKDWLDSGYMTYEQILTIIGVSDGDEETCMYS